MSDPELVDLARRWFRFAMEDLDVAQCLLAPDGSRPRLESASVSLTCPVESTEFRDFVLTL